MYDKKHWIRENGNLHSGDLIDDRMDGPSNVFTQGNEEYLTRTDLGDGWVGKCMITLYGNGDIDKKYYIENMIWVVNPKDSTEDFLKEVHQLFFISRKEMKNLKELMNMSFLRLEIKDLCVRQISSDGLVVQALRKAFNSPVISANIWGADISVLTDVPDRIADWKKIKGLKGRACMLVGAVN